MDDTLLDSSVRKRLSMQNEVLKWLENFSEKLQKRANSATLELHELLDQTGVVEQDLRNTFNSFRNLSHLQFVENKISEGDEVPTHMREATDNPLHADIPAQSYEADILPRYKEALSIGLNSYKHHFQKRTTSFGSLYKFGAAYGPLPHVIGSEEYVHDNSCGLVTEGFILDTAPLDFSRLSEADVVDSKSEGFDTMFSAEFLGIEQDQSAKEGVDPLVSAALDFKAMLEAALLSPYKFYNEESSSLPDTVGNQDNDGGDVHEKMVHVSSSTVSFATPQNSQCSTSIENSHVPITAENPTFPTEPDSNAHQLCSALISESLFDMEEDCLLSNEMQSTQDPASTEPYSFESVQFVDEAGGASGLFIQENPDIYSGDDKETVQRRPQLDVLDDSDAASSRSHSSLGNMEAVASMVSFDGNHKAESSKNNFQDDSLGCQISGGESSDGSLATSDDLYKNKVSGQTIDPPPPLPSTLLFNDSDIDDVNIFLEPLSEPTVFFSNNSSENLSLVSHTESMPFSRGKNAKSEAAKPIINDIPRREEPAFSTVASVSPELSSLFFSASLSESHGLDTKPSSIEEKNSNVVALEDD